MCYCYGDVLLLWLCVTVMVMCRCYGDVLLAPTPNSTRTGAPLYVLYYSGEISCSEQSTKLMEGITMC